MASLEPDLAEGVEVADGIELPAAALEKGRLDDVRCVAEFDVDVLVELWVMVIVVSIVATPRLNRLVEAAQSQLSKFKQQYSPEPQACSPFPVTSALLLENSARVDAPGNANMILTTYSCCNPRSTPKCSNTGSCNPNDRSLWNHSLSRWGLAHRGRCSDKSILDYNRVLLSHWDGMAPKAPGRQRYRSKSSRWTTARQRMRKWLVIPNQTEKSKTCEKS